MDMNHYKPKSVKSPPFLPGDRKKMVTVVTIQTGLRAYSPVFVKTGWSRIIYASYSNALKTG